MKLLDKLERRFRRFAVPNVIVPIIFCQVLLYVVSIVQPGIGNRLFLIPTKVFAGEVWQVVSFLLMPPVLYPASMIELVFAFFYWYVLYLMGSTLENTWGAFRFNVYLLIGWLATAGATLALGCFIPNVVATNEFLYGSVFLAFAWLYPDFEFLIFFIISLKVKWLALLAWIGYFFVLLLGSPIAKVLVLASIANFLLFFSVDIYYKMRTGRRRMKQQARQIKAKHTPRHTCTVCGITNLDDPKIRFRYCSKCEGGLCYCSEHINDHEHVTPETIDESEP